MSKSTLIAAVVFAALLAAAFVTLREKPERGITHLSFTEIAPADVTRVVGHGKNEFELERTEDGWKLADGRPVQSAAADRLAEAIPRIDSSTVVTQNPDRFAELEVDDDAGTTIVVYGGDRQLAEFTVGKDAGRGANIRVDDAVYITPGVYQSLFRRDPAAWIEKKLFTLKPDGVRRVDVALGNGTSYALVKEEEGWALEDRSVLPPGFRFDSSQARNLVRSLASLHAGDVLAEDPGTETTGLDADVDVFTLADDEQEPHTLTLGRESDGDVYARATGWEQVVKIPTSRAQGLRRAPASFRDLSLMKIEPSEITRLEIRSDDQDLVFERTSAEADWQIAASPEEELDGFELDPNKVSARLFALGAARALDVAGPDAEADFASPTTVLTVTTGDGETASLLFAGGTSQGGKASVLARGNADGETYVVTEPLRADLAGGLDTFRKTAAPPGRPAFDPASLQNLPPEVRARLLQQMRTQSR